MGDVKPMMDVEEVVQRLLDRAESDKKRITELEGALSDAIGAIEHAAHPVASQWLPLLRKKLGKER